MELVCHTDAINFPGLYIARFTNLHVNINQFKEDFLVQQQPDRVHQDEDVHGLLFENCMVLSLSPDLAEKFPRVTHIVFKDSSLENVEWGSFEIFKRLQQIRVENCTVELFLGTIFEKCSKLEFNVDVRNREETLLDAAMAVRVQRDPEPIPILPEPIAPQQQQAPRSSLDVFNSKVRNVASQTSCFSFTAQQKQQQNGNNNNNNNQPKPFKPWFKKDKQKGDDNFQELIDKLKAENQAMWSMTPNTSGLAFLDSNPGPSATVPRPKKNANKKIPAPDSNEAGKKREAEKEEKTDPETVKPFKAPPKPAFSDAMWRGRCRKLEAHIISLNVHLELKQVELARLQSEFRLFNDIKAILADDSFRDFRFVIDDIDFPVHKLLVAARSSTFADMIRASPEAEEMRLVDVPVSIFQLLVDFLYSNQLSACDESLYEVFAAAGRLNIVDLMQVTAQRLISRVNESNAYEVLVLANKYDNEDLLESAFACIQKKIFPERFLSAELARQPEKVRRLIEMKRRLDEEFESLSSDFSSIVLKEEENDIKKEEVEVMKSEQEEGRENAVLEKAKVSDNEDEEIEVIEKDSCDNDESFVKLP